MSHLHAPRDLHLPGQDPHLTDAHLLHRCAEGERSACAALVDRHEAAVWRYARALTSDPIEAEDLLQETFLAAIRGGAGFAGEGSARAWLLAITRHALHRLRRRRVGEPARTEPLDELGAAAGWGEDPEAALSGAEAHAGLHRAIESLAPADREVLVLRDLEGLSGEATAALLGLPLATTKTRLHRARLRLRAALRQGGTDGHRP